MGNQFSLVSILLLGITLKVSGQVSNTCMIKGQVYDSKGGETLIGVNIYLKNTRIGTVSDASGKFKIRIPSEENTLIFSYIGYQTQEIVVKPCEQLKLNVLLKSSEVQIDEVKITAQRKFFGNMDYGREIPSIGAEIIERQNINNASDILHARIAGVWATKTSGAPGDHQRIRIRGQSSFFSSAEPLYVVDGVPVPIVNLSSLGIADLNIHDVDNITVLKDASSTSLYGFQGGNGVILIDTKQGGENEINFSTRIGYQWFDNYYELMSSEEQIISLDSAHSKMNILLEDFYPELSDTLCNRDWQREIFSPGSIQEYQLNAAGTTGKLKYYLSGNYTNHQGILPNSEYERYTFFTRVGHTFRKRMSLDLVYRGSIQENKNNQDEYKGNQLIWEGINKSPCLECTPENLLYTEEGMEIKRIYYEYPSLNSPRYPAAIIASNNNDLRINNNAISGFIRFRINDHLSMDFMESFMMRHIDYINKLGTIGVMLKSREDVILYNHQVNLSFYNTYDKHDIGLLLANRFYTDNLWWQVDSLEGTLPEHYFLKNSMAAYGQKGSVLRNMSSYIGHISYSYRKAYFISAICNVSKLKEGLYTDYYSLFPSLAISWDLAQENIFRNSKWMNNFSLFFNIGASGNYPLNGLANDLFYEVFYTYGDTTDYYPAVDQFANHHLKHEKTAETDYGLKSSFLNKRLGFNLVYYDKSITNMIIQRQIPYYYGGGKMFYNLGKVSVKGVDMMLDAVPIQKQNFTWHVQFNFSKSKQRVEKLDNGDPLLFQDWDVLMPEFLIEEGEALGNIYGYQCLGKWMPSDDDMESNLHINRGGMKFLNADTTNNVLNDHDKVIIGNSVPDYTWNFSNAFRYKNLSFELLWYAVWGLEKFNATRATTLMSGLSSEINSYINNKVHAIQANYLYESSEFIDNASFVRLKKLSIGYHDSKKVFNKMEMNFSLSFENLLTITKYTGYDPEATIFTDNNFSDNSIDKGAYPNPKATYISIHLKF